MVLKISPNPTLRVGKKIKEEEHWSGGRRKTSIPGEAERKKKITGKPSNYTVTGREKLTSAQKVGVFFLLAFLKK